MGWACCKAHPLKNSSQEDHHGDPSPFFLFNFSKMESLLALECGS